MRPPHADPSGTFLVRFLILAVVLGTAAVAPAVAYAAGSWTWPAEGEVATPYENGDDPYAAGQHRGIDIAAPAGDPVVAATAGTVTFAGTVGAAGLTVAIRTADGRFDTSYLHLESASVEAGDHVEPGDPVGAVGTSGTGSIEEAHLHFGVRVAGEDHAYRNPLNFLGAPGAAPPEQPPVPVVPPLAPGPVPTPAPAPVAPPRPVPAPGPGSAGAPRPVPAPGPSPARDPAARPVQRPALRPLPGPLPRPAGRPRPAPGPARSPAHGPTGTPEHAPGHEPVPVPSLGPGAAASDRPGAPAQLGAAPVAALDGPASAGTDAPAATAGGVDVGWVLALVGVALAGAAMLRPAALSSLLRRGSGAAGGIRRASWGRS